MDDPSAAYFVFQSGEPSIEFLGALKGIHAQYCIQKDTYVQFRIQGRWSWYGRPNEAVEKGDFRRGARRGFAMM